MQPEERENPLTPLNAHSAKHYVSLRPATWAIAQVALGTTPHNTRYAKSQLCICRVADSCDFTELCSLCDIIFYPETPFWRELLSLHITTPRQCLIAVRIDL